MNIEIKKNKNSPNKTMRQKSIHKIQEVEKNPLKMCNVKFHQSKKIKRNTGKNSMSLNIFQSNLLFPLFETNGGTLSKSVV